MIKKTKYGTLCSMTQNERMLEVKRTLKSLSKSFTATYEIKAKWQIQLECGHWVDAVKLKKRREDSLIKCFDCGPNADPAIWGTFTVDNADKISGESIGNGEGI